MKSNSPNTDSTKLTRFQLVVKLAQAEDMIRSRDKHITELEAELAKARGQRVYEYGLLERLELLAGQCLVTHEDGTGDMLERETVQAMADRIAQLEKLVAMFDRTESLDSFENLSLKTRIAELEADYAQATTEGHEMLTRALKAEREMWQARDGVRQKHITIRVMEESERLGKSELDRLYAKYPDEEKAHIYGRCPQCGSPGETRIVGVKTSNDRCTEGHFYRSDAALGEEPSDV